MFHDSISRREELLQLKPKNGRKKRFERMGRGRGETCSLSRVARKRLPLPPSFSLPLWKNTRGEVSYTRDDGVEDPSSSSSSSSSSPTPILSLDFRTSSTRKEGEKGRREGGNETVYVAACGVVKHARNHVFSTTFRAMKVARLPGARDTSRPLERKIERTGFLFLRLCFFFFLFWSSRD